MAKETPSELDFVSLKNIMEQLAGNKSILKELDQKIAAYLKIGLNLRRRFLTQKLSKKTSMRPLHR